MASKRKRPQLDDSDEDEPFMGKQVLPIANLPADFNGEPEDGLQYLFKVRRDARRLPHTTRVVNPYEIKEEPPDDGGKKDELAASGNLPSEAWRETFLCRFRNFRKNCTQPTIHIDLPQRSAHKLMPDRKDRDAWWAFLTGRPENEWNPPKKPKAQKNKDQRYGDSVMGMRGYPSEPGPSRVGYEESCFPADPAEMLPTPSGTPAPPDRAAEVRPVDACSSTDNLSPVITQPNPTPTLMRDIDHRYAVHLLMYFAHWINLYLEEDMSRKYTIKEAHARWMFVLLSRVDDYISADETSTLRSLARGCISLIKERRAETLADPALGEDSLNSSDSISEPSCWMIITAIIGIWAQKDLWQDADVVLSKRPIA